MTRHQLDPSPSTTADVFSRDLPPVLTVDPGDTIVLRSLNASGHLQPQTFPGEDVPTMASKRRSGHCLTGPIAVRGAVPGEVLAVRFLALRPETWGYTVAGGRDTPLTRRLGLHEGPPAWLLWQIDVDAGVATSDLGHTVRIAPFHGVTGVAWDEPGEHSTIPPRAVGGGNIDCRELVAGSVLYLPVAVPGALLSIGDGHAAQGDGEVAGTAIECGMTTELQLDLVTDRPVPGVHAETPAGRITFGFSPDLNAAMGDALDAMLTWLQASYGVGKATALALASPVLDLRVTQVANESWGVHALLPAGAIRLGGVVEGGTASAAPSGPRISGLVRAAGIGSSRTHWTRDRLAQACAPTVTVPTVRVAVASMTALTRPTSSSSWWCCRGGQLAHWFHGDSELAARAPLVPHPPTMPSTSSTG